MDSPSKLYPDNFFQAGGKFTPNNFYWVFKQFKAFLVSNFGEPAIAVIQKKDGFEFDRSQLRVVPPELKFPDPTKFSSEYQKALDREKERMVATELNKILNNWYLHDCPKILAEIAATILDSLSNESTQACKAYPGFKEAASKRNDPFILYKALVKTHSKGADFVCQMLHERDSLVHYENETISGFAARYSKILEVLKEANPNRNTEDDGRKFVDLLNKGTNDLVDDMYRELSRRDIFSPSFAEASTFLINEERTRAWRSKRESSGAKLPYLEVFGDQTPATKRSTKRTGIKKCLTMGQLGQQLGSIVGKSQNFSGNKKSKRVLNGAQNHRQLKKGRFSVLPPSHTSSERQRAR